MKYENIKHFLTPIGPEELEDFYLWLSDHLEEYTFIKEFADKIFIMKSEMALTPALRNKINEDNYDMYSIPLPQSDDPIMAPYILWFSENNEFRDKLISDGHYEFDFYERRKISPSFIEKFGA